MGCKQNVEFHYNTLNGKGEGVLHSELNSTFKHTETYKHIETYKHTETYNTLKHTNTLNPILPGHCHEKPIYLLKTC